MCGPEFTQNLEGMFKDMDSSKSLMAAYRDSKHYSETKSIDFSVYVLTSSYWPSYTSESVYLPEEATALVF